MCFLNWVNWRGPTLILKLTKKHNIHTKTTKRNAIRTNCKILLLHEPQSHLHVQYKKKLGVEQRTTSFNLNRWNNNKTTMTLAEMPNSRWKSHCVHLSFFLGKWSLLLLFWRWSIISLPFKMSKHLSTWSHYTWDRANRESRKINN